MDNDLNRSIHSLIGDLDEFEEIIEGSDRGLLMMLIKIKELETLSMINASMVNLTSSIINNSGDLNRISSAIEDIKTDLYTMNNNADGSSPVVNQAYLFELQNIKEALQGIYSFISAKYSVG